MKKLLLLSLAMLTLCSSLLAAELKPRLVFEKYLFAEGVDPKARDLNQLMVKFFDEDMVRLEDGSLISTNGRTSLGYVQDFLARHPEIRVERIITEPEDSYTARTAWAEERSGIDLVDLFSFYNFRLPAPAADAKGLLADILSAPEVEIAYYEPIAVPATCTDLGNTTPNYAPNQTYHDPAPGGVDLDYAMTAYGADVVDGAGTGTWTAIVEWGPGFHFNHEDFSNFVNATPEDAPDSTSYHGTAVAGILGGCDDNNVGVLGFLADQTMRGYDVNALASHADVYNRVNSNLIAGEVCNSSWGYFSSPMPPGQTCPCNPGQNGMVTIEYNPAVKAAIQAGVAEGIHFFISAGNGCTNLDHTVYGSTFRWSTETGSCYIGGVQSPAAHNAICYTNWGERVTLNGWSENVVTTGYGGLWSGQGRNEYYTSGFNGTSSASPMVAGVGGVLNNLYRANNAGANIAPVTLRSWLDDGGTAPGTTPGNIGLLPNLFQITAPELNPDIRSGWTSYIVPRNTNDATGSDAVLPGTLNSEPSATYWNSAIENTSHFGTATPGYWRLFRDDSYFLWASVGSLGPEGRTYHANTQFPSGDVRGGRHTIRITADPLAEVTEADEGNNSYTTQFVWNPRALTSDSPLQFSRPPTRFVTDQPGAYANVDGYAGSGFTGWWDIMAVLSQTSAADYDVAFYTEAVTSTNGFDDTQEYSGYVGPLDFVGINNNMQAGSLQAAAINWDNSDDDYIVEGQTSTILTSPTFGRNLAVAAAINTDEIFDNWEFLVSELNIPYIAELEVTGGSANLAISIFGPDDLYFSASDRNWFANSNGDGLGEMLTFTPTVSGWYGIVVHKYDGNSWGDNASFNLYLGKAQFDLTHNLNAGWSHKIVVRQSTGAAPAVLPATLPGNNSLNHLNAAYINQGAVASPAGLNDRFYLDGPAVHTTGSWSGWPAGATTAWVNQGPIFVFGGRHNVGDVIDIFNEGAEWLETNNRHDEQFVWTPVTMIDQTSHLTTNPAPNFNNSESAIPFGAPNCDGWRFTGSSYWSGVAMTPVDPDDDYNIALYNPSTGSENGFDAHLVPSWIAADGATEFVVENGNLNGVQSYDVGTRNNYPWPGTPSEGSYRMYQCNRVQDLLNNQINGPFTLGTNALIHVFDLHLTAGSNVPFVLDNLGATDLGLAIFDATDNYGSRSTNGTVINAAGDGADETTVFVPTTTGWHGVVVFKNDHSDLASTDYRLILGERIPATPTGLVMEVLNSAANPIETRIAWNPVTTDVNGAPIVVDHYSIYYTTDDTNEYPGGWLLAGTTTLNPINLYVGTAVPYLRVLVIAVDVDGVLVGGSGLPAGVDLTGMRESDLPGRDPNAAVWLASPEDPRVTVPTRD